MYYSTNFGTKSHMAPGYELNKKGWVKRYFIRLLFEDMEIRQRIVNIEEFSSYSVGVFRTYYDKHRDDPWFETTVERLIQNSAEFERIWRQYDVQLKK